MIDCKECDMHFRGLHKNFWREYELWECIQCGRTELRPYNGAIDTVEGIL